MYKVLDLFCGLGGFTYGFEKTNKFQVVLGVDIWDVALKSFKHNHKKTDILNEDLSNIPDEFWENYKKKVDVIIAGPPCQGFSMSGKREVGDNRNQLYKQVIRAAAIIEPSVVIIENVKGLLSMQDHEGNYIKELIKQDLESLGYYVEFDVLNSADYGVPQNRQRVIYIASKIGKISHPKKLYGNELKPYITVGDALGNIPEMGTDYLSPVTQYQKSMSSTSSNIIYNHEKIIHNDLITKRMASVPQGGNWENIPLILGQGGGKHSNNYRRLDSSKPSITIKHATKSMLIHPFFNRTPTVREIARLQSFDDDFIIFGNKTDQHQQLANAVPPILGTVLAREILKYFEMKKGTDYDKK